MQVTVLLFASYAEALGTDALRLELPGAPTVGDAVAAVRRAPGGDKVPAAPLVARNQQYARLDDPIHPSDEVAIIPPVAGG